MGPRGTCIVLLGPVLVWHKVFRHWARAGRCGCGQGCLECTVQKPHKIQYILITSHLTVPCTLIPGATTHSSRWRGKRETCTIHFNQLALTL